MTCGEARDRFSDAVDDRMSPAERRELDAHLAGCNDCRRDFERFTATVSLMRSMPPVHVPAGFVDRVLHVTAQRPWYRRLLAHVFLPLPVKLPVEAAAIVLVAVGVVYLFQATPELQRAARFETAPVTTPQVATPAPSTPAPPAPAYSAPVPAKESRAPESRISSTTESRASSPEVPPRTEAQAAGKVQRSPGVSEERAARSTDEPKALDAPSVPARPPTAAAPAPQAATPVPPPAKAEAPNVAPPRSAIDAARRDMAKSAPGEESSDARRERAKQAPFSVAPVEPGVAQQSPRVVQPAPGVARLAPAIRSQALTARAADVSGVLQVTDAVVARRGLAGLVARYGAVELAERGAKDSDVVELVVPRAVYPAFARDVASIGHWNVQSEPTDLPDQVVVSIRIAPRP